MLGRSEPALDQLVTARIPDPQPGGRGIPGWRRRAQVAEPVQVDRLGVPTPSATQLAELGGDQRELDQLRALEDARDGDVPGDLLEDAAGDPLAKIGTRAEDGRRVPHDSLAQV